MFCTNVLFESKLKIMYQLNFNVDIVKLHRNLFVFYFIFATITYDCFQNVRHILNCFLKFHFTNDFKISMSFKKKYDIYLKKKIEKNLLINEAVAIYSNKNNYRLWRIKVSRIFNEKSTYFSIYNIIFELISHLKNQHFYCTAYNVHGSDLFPSLSSE